MKKTILNTFASCPVYLSLATVYAIHFYFVARKKWQNFTSIKNGYVRLESNF
jgi:hypothetical protein